jgi:hypothetical protein
MLSYELMGVFALGVLWVNSLLIIGAALSSLRRLLRRLGAWRRDGLMAATVVSEGVFARHEIEQTGHKAADDAGDIAIVFHDRNSNSSLLGGEIELDGERAVVEPGEDVEVWVTRDEQRAAAACPSAEAFAAAYKASRKARGHRRKVVTELGEGDAIRVHGVVRDGRLVAPVGLPLVVASFDPRSWCRRRVALILAFQLTVLGLVSGITFLALYPPVFGTVSTLGGMLGLVYFLGIQPIGVAVRESTRLPPDAPLRGSWSDEHGADADQPMARRALSVPKPT